MNLANSMELERSRNYWLSKGFARPKDFSVRLERCDCHIVYRYNSWQLIENGGSKPTKKAKLLNSLLASFI